jgi:hypothetical protein
MKWLSFPSTGRWGIQPLLFLWQDTHFTGAAFPFAFSALWQPMQVPTDALGLWNAAWSLVFMGDAATFVWQSEQTCCAALLRFSGLDGWWHVSHLIFRAWE